MADVDLTIERSTIGIVTTKDRTLQTRGLSMIVHAGLINVARLLIIITITTTEQVVGLKGRAIGHIDDGTACSTFITAGTIYIIYITTNQVNDGRARDTIGIRHGGLGGNTDTDTTKVASTKDVGSGKVVRVRCHIHQHIAAILHLVTIQVAFRLVTMSLTSTKDSLDAITGNGVCLEIDNGIIHIRLAEARLRTTVFVGVLLVMVVGIIIVTITASKDMLYTSLNILRIGISLKNIRLFLVFRVVHQWQRRFTDTTCEVAGTKYLTAQIVTAIDMVTNPREA